MSFLRYGLSKNFIEEIKDIHFLNQTNNDGNPLFPVVIHIIFNYSNMSVKDAEDFLINVEEYKANNYLVYFNGKLAYTVNEMAKNIDLFLDDLKRKKSVKLNCYEN